MKTEHKQYILARLREPSTWRGISYVLTAFGITLSPDVTDAISILVMGLCIVGGIGIVTPDTRRETK